MSWKRAFFASLFAIPILALLAFGTTRDPKKIDSPLPGHAAPGFKLAVFSYPTDAPPAMKAAGFAMKDSVQLDSLKGKVVVLNFWASWCLACRDEHAQLSAAAMALRGEDVRFYGVLYQDVPQNGRDWIQEMGGQSYEGLYDPKTRTAIDYGLYGVPETFFIGRDGRVRYKHVGPVSMKTVLDTVRVMLQARGN
jgi:cytochrome c biogenesis protein CcmG/thiol:disulfide interchange protein DsbE